MAYENTFVYVLQYNYTFQYLFAWGNEVFRQEIILRPRLLRRMAWRLGLVSIPYNTNQLEQGEQIILSGAMKSIDLLKKDKKGYHRKRAEKKRLEKCSWQARADEEGKPIYFCLTHNAVAEFEEDPSHK